MPGLGAIPEGRVLQLDEVADIRLGAEHAAWTQPRERAAIGTLADYRTLKMGVGLDDRTATPRAVLDPAVRSDLHVVFDDNRAFEHHIHIDPHITAHTHLPAHIEARPIAPRPPPAPQTPTRPPLVKP